jgi:hypothetical protein
VAADDSTLRTIGTEETVKFVGASGITTASDDEGKITITQGTTSSLVNGAHTASLGTDGSLTIPGDIRSEGNINIDINLSDSVLRRWSFGEDGNLTFPDATNQSTAFIPGNTADATAYNSGSSNTSSYVYDGIEFISENKASFSINYNPGGSIPPFTFNLDYQLPYTVGSGISVAGVQTSKIVSEGNINIDINLSEGVLRRWTFGENSSLTFPDSTVQTTAWTGAVDFTGLATETFVTTRGYITGLSYNDLTDKPNLAGTYQFSVAADDSTQRLISTDEVIKFIGAGSITTASDAEGNITITGAAPDRLTSNARSAVLNSNGTFSLPTLAAEPASPQAGQMALANGVSWDPITQNNGAPYMVIYTGTAWIGMGGGVTVDQVYDMILEMT